MQPVIAIITRKALGEWRPPPSNDKKSLKKIPTNDTMDSSNKVK